jgi:hypothetical protein
MYAPQLMARQRDNNRAGDWLRELRQRASSSEPPQLSPNEKPGNRPGQFEVIFGAETPAIKRVQIALSVPK